MSWCPWPTDANLAIILYLCFEPLKVRKWKLFWFENKLLNTLYAVVYRPVYTVCLILAYVIEAYVIETYVIE